MAVRAKINIRPPTSLTKAHIGKIANLVSQRELGAATTYLAQRAKKPLNVPEKISRAFG